MPESELPPPPETDPTITVPHIGRGDIIYLNPRTHPPHFRRWEVAFLVVNLAGTAMVALTNERLQATSFALDDLEALKARGEIVGHDRFSIKNSLPYTTEDLSSFTAQYEIGTLIRHN